MKTAGFISAVVFLVAGLIGMIYCLSQRWSPPEYVVAAVAFTALMIASNERLQRYGKDN